MTVQELSAATNVRDTTIRSAIQKGLLPFTRLYGRNLVTREDWDAYRARAKRGRPAKKKEQTDADPGGQIHWEMD